MRQIYPKECWIFDVDGTISNPSHRKPYVERPEKRWDLWNNTMHLDTCHEDVAKFTVFARQQHKGVVICTGREDDKLLTTQEWLKTYNIPYDDIYMRAAKDYRSDDIIKEELLNKMIADNWIPVLTFDDRNSVVAMWRRRGIRCFQVADGNF